MYKIDELSIKDYLKDRTYSYFKPLIFINNLVFKTDKNSQIDILNETLMNNLVSKQFNLLDTNYSQSCTEKNNYSFDLFNQYSIDLLRKNYA